MKRTLMFLFVVLSVAACGSGGSDGPAAADVDEGTGASVDVSNSSTVEGHLKTIIGIVDDSFDTAQSNSSSTSSSNPTVSSTSGGSSPSSSMVIGAAFEGEEGALKGSSTGICVTNNYSKDINKTLNGTKGTAVFTGNASAEKIGSDQLTMSADIKGVFNGYQRYSSSYTLTGTTNMEGGGEITKGLSALCSSLNTSGLELSVTARYFGSISISGAIGAAMSYDFDVTENASGGKETITVEGTAQFKSNDKTVNCTVGRNSDPDTDVNNYTITCN